MRTTLLVYKSQLGTFPRKVNSWYWGKKRVGPGTLKLGSPVSWLHISDSPHFSHLGGFTKGSYFGKKMMTRPRYDRFKLGKRYRSALAKQFANRKLTQRRVTNLVATGYAPDTAWFMYNGKYIT